MPIGQSFGQPGGQPQVFYQPGQPPPQQGYNHQQQYVGVPEQAPLAYQPVSQYIFF